MYHLLTGLYAHYTRRPRYNILLLGVNGSGKTAWLDKVRSQITNTGSRSLSRFHPTVGQNVLDLNLSHATLHFWDLGGEASLRRLWSRYFDEADVLVWAMDSRDWVNLVVKDDDEGAEQNGDAEDHEKHEVKRQESWQALSKLCTQSRLTSLPLLILFTHYDQLDQKQANLFERKIKQIVREKLSQLEAAEKSELEEEMNHLDHSMEGQQHSRQQIWKDWQVLLCSARDGTGVEEFVDWLHTHAKRAQG